MAVPGIDIVGLLPDGVQIQDGVLGRAVRRRATHPDAGRALIAHLATPAAAKVMRDNGMETG